MSDSDGLREFTFDELSERAKMHACDKVREHGCDHDWWEYTCEDAVNIGKLLGIEIYESSSRTISGKPVSSPDINFSGFGSQGDGADYTGMLCVGLMKDAVAKIKGETSDNDSYLVSLAKDAESLYAEFARIWTMFRLSTEIDAGDLVELDRIGVSIMRTSYRGYSVHVENIDERYEALESQCNKFVKDFSNWIYRQLEKEWESITSDEYISQNLRDSGAKFDSFGSLI